MFLFIVKEKISPTVNVLIHSEGKNLLKNKKAKGQKRINSNNNKSKTNNINENLIEKENKIKQRRKQFNDSKKKYKKYENY